MTLTRLKNLERRRTNDMPQSFPTTWPVAIVSRLEVSSLVTGGAGDESVGGPAGEAAHPAEADEEAGQEAGQAGPNTDRQRGEASREAAC